MIGEVGKSIEAARSYESSYLSITSKNYGGAYIPTTKVDAYDHTVDKPNQTNMDTIVYRFQSSIKWYDASSSIQIRLIILTFLFKSLDACVFIIILI